MMKALLLVLLIITGANALEIPDKPHKEFAFFLDIDVDEKEQHLQIFSNGEIYFANNKERGELSTKVDPAVVQKIYDTARKAVQTAKKPEAAEGPLGRKFSIMYDLDHGSFFLPFNENALEAGLYDQLVALVRDVMKQVRR